MEEEEEEDKKAVPKMSYLTWVTVSNFITYLVVKRRTHIVN